MFLVKAQGVPSAEEFIDIRVFDGESPELGVSMRLSLSARFSKVFLMGRFHIFGYYLAFYYIIIGLFVVALDIHKDVEQEIGKDILVFLSHPPTPAVVGPFFGASCSYLNADRFRSI